MGATALPASVVAPGLAAGLLSQAGLRLPARQYYALSCCERRQSRAAGALLAIIAEAAPSPRGGGREGEDALI